MLPLTLFVVHDVLAVAGSCSEEIHISDTKPGFLLDRDIRPRLIGDDAVVRPLVHADQVLRATTTRQTCTKLPLWSGARVATLNPKPKP